MKRKWSTPQLVLLVHTHAEESVLSACKAASAGPGAAILQDESPNDLFGGCYTALGAGISLDPSCTPCSDLPSS
jgi:hypothetical protein